MWPFTKYDQLYFFFLLLILINSNRNNFHILFVQYRKKQRNITYGDSTFEKIQNRVVG